MAPTNGKRSENGRPSLLGYLISVFLGTGGATLVIGGTPVGQQFIRPDPATGTELRRIEQHIDRVDTKADTNKEKVDKHLIDHPDKTGSFETRLQHLESENRYLRERVRELERSK